MIIKLILAAVVCYVVWTGMAQYKKLEKSKQRDFLIRAAVFAFIAVMVLGALTGRMHWLGALVAALLPLLRFGAGALFKVLPFWASRGGSIPIKTAYLDVIIQAATGQMTGTVVHGQFEGRTLDSLSAQELQALSQECEQSDKKAYYLLRFVRTEQPHQNANPPPNFDDPAYEEALQILGLSPNPTKEDIIKAHKRLIHKLHPDRGGSDFLAARVNQARDVLLKYLK